jgi:ABC-2 type transport system permease protein
MFVIYIGGLGWIVYQTQNVMAIPLALAMFAAIILPGILLIGAFSIVCPAIIWVPLYQVLFVGYWFWGNLFPPGRGVPTMSNTILTPAGGNAPAGFFGLSFFQVTHATLLQGVESIVLQLGLAMLAMRDLKNERDTVAALLQARRN